MQPMEGHFGQRLASLRQKAGLSQREFARTSGFSARMIAYYETRAALPLGHVLSALAKALGISVDELVGHRPSKAKTPQLSPRLLRRLSLVERLPLKDKRELFSIIDMYLAKNHLSDAHR